MQIHELDNYIRGADPAYLPVDDGTETTKIKLTDIIDTDSIKALMRDTFFRVGSVYETSDANFDPNVTWGGTWELEIEGQVHVSAGTNYPVAGALNNASDGGEATHILTIDEIPSHQHKVSLEGQGTSVGTITWSNTEGGLFGGLYSEWVGGGQAHNNMMPYINYYRWHRTA